MTDETERTEQAERNAPLAEGASPLSDMLSTILSNPEAMSRISALAGQLSREGGEPPPLNEEALRVPLELEKKLENTPKKAPSGGAKQRRMLLLALKPYLSSERAAMVESIIKISDLTDLVGPLLEGGLLHL